MGKDKVENEELIKYAYPNDIWYSDNANKIGFM